MSNDGERQLVDSQSIIGNTGRFDLTKITPEWLTGENLGLIVQVDETENNVTNASEWCIKDDVINSVISSRSV